MISTEYVYLDIEVDERTCYQVGSQDKEHG